MAVEPALVFEGGETISSWAQQAIQRKSVLRRDMAQPEVAISFGFTGKDARAVQFVTRNIPDPLSQKPALSLI